MAKKKGVRCIVTLECTEARGLGETPSRYTTQKVRTRLLPGAQRKETGAAHAANRLTESSWERRDCWWGVAVRLHGTWPLKWVRL